MAGAATTVAAAGGAAATFLAASGAAAVLVLARLLLLALLAFLLAGIAAAVPAGAASGATVLAAAEPRLRPDRVMAVADEEEEEGIEREFLDSARMRCELLYFGLQVVGIKVYLEPLGNQACLVLCGCAVCDAKGGTLARLRKEVASC